MDFVIVIMLHFFWRVCSLFSSFRSNLQQHFLSFLFFCWQAAAFADFSIFIDVRKDNERGKSKKWDEMGMNVGTAAGFVCLRAAALGVSEFYSNLTLIKWHVTGLSSVTRRKRKWRCQMRKECTSGKHVWSRVRYREHYLREVKGSKETFV